MNTEWSLEEIYKGFDDEAYEADFKKLETAEVHVYNDIDTDVYKRQVGSVQLNSKGVYREVESEGSCKQISGLTDRNHI